MELLAWISTSLWAVFESVPTFFTDSLQPVFACSQICPRRGQYPAARRSTAGREEVPTGPPDSSTYYMYSAPLPSSHLQYSTLKPATSLIRRSPSRIFSTRFVFPSWIHFFLCVWGFLPIEWRFDARKKQHDIISIQECPASSSGKLLGHDVFYPLLLGLT